MEEIWKDVFGYEGYYQVSNIGNIKGVDRIIKYKSDGERLYKGINFKQETTKDGYKRVVLMKEGVKQRYMVHRLVAQTFIENPENKPYINHIDGDKGNNVVANLEWCTNSENVLHADSIGLRDMSNHQPSNSKSILCVEKEIEFKSISKALKWLGTTNKSTSTITRAIKNNRKAFGYTWEYV